MTINMFLRFDRNNNTNNNNINNCNENQHDYIKILIKLSLVTFCVILLALLWQSGIININKFGENSNEIKSKLVAYNNIFWGVRSLIGSDQTTEATRKGYQLKRILESLDRLHGTVQNQQQQLNIIQLKLELMNNHKNVVVTQKNMEGYNQTLEL